MAWSLAQTPAFAFTNASGTTVATGVTVVGSGHLLIAIMLVGNHAKAWTGVSDGTNAFTQFPGAQFSDATDNVAVDVWYLLSSVAGTTITATVNGAASTDGRDIFLIEMAGAVTPARDAVAVQATIQTGSGTDDIGPALTTAGASDGVAIGYVVPANDIATNPKTGNEFTSGGVHNPTVGDAVCTLLAPSGAAHTPVWTDTTGNAGYQALTVAFKETAVVSPLVGGPRGDQRPFPFTPSGAGMR